MDFYIHKDVVGANEHIHYYSGKVRYTNELADQDWCFGDDDYIENNLKIALYLAGHEIATKPPEAFTKAMSQITLARKLPWQKIMPSNQYHDYVIKICKNIAEIAEKNSFSYYKNVYKKTSYMLNSLMPSKIHKKRYGFLVDNNIGGVNKGVIESFAFDQSGFSSRVVYDQLNSISGRLTVKSGPQILLLNKEFKSIIKSRYRNGHVYSFDYVSLEPRIALILGGKNPSHDIYNEINENVFSNSLTRQAVKIACLSVLYGSGANSLHKETGIPLKECQNIIMPQIKKYFNVFDISRKLVNTYKKHGKIWNFFGRAIYPKECVAYKLYNNYVQSTAVDVANLGFYNIVTNIDEACIPLFVIHDNILIDMPDDACTNKIMSLGENIYKFEHKIPLECSKI